MLKGIFASVVLLNLVVFYCSAQRFLISLAPLHFLGGCMPDSLSHAAHDASSAMQNFLLPAAAWLSGIAALDLLFAGIVIFHKLGNDT
jgi:hypothetical protein